MPIPAISIRFGSGSGLLNFKIVLITNLIVGRGGVDSPRGVSKRVKNKWGGVEPTPFVLNRVENERGGLEPTPFVSKPVEKKWSGVESTPFVSKHVENERGGVEPTLFVSKTGGVMLKPPRSCQKVSKPSWEGLNPPVRVESR